LEFASKYEFPFYSRAGQMHIGWALAQQGEAGAGAAMIRASVDQHRNEGIRKFEPYWRSLLAEALALAGQFGEALDEVENALAFAEATENGYWNAHLLKLKADYLLAQQFAADEVESWYERAVATARRQGARSLELRATLALCRLWAQRAKGQQACTRLASLYSSFTEGWDTADLQEAQMLLAHLRGELRGGEASFGDATK
jgi:predicted ATPase